MKNTYDILVNFKKYAYEFYEWNKDDDIKHVKSIPTFKVSSSCLLDFTNYNLVVSKDFLKQIENKTEIFCKGLVIAEKYACILFCKEKAIAFNFDNEGNIIGRSNLLFDESDDIIKSFYNIEQTKIDYNVISECNSNSNFTRQESKMIKNLLQYLKQVDKNKEKYELMYLYLECFNKMVDDEKKAYNELVFEVENANFKIIEKLDTLIKVLKK